MEESELPGTPSPELEVNAETVPDDIDTEDFLNEYGRLSNVVIVAGTWQYLPSDGGQGVSEWIFVINTLRVDTMPMVLNGVAVTAAMTLSGRDVKNNAKLRTTQDGQPPYSYSSSDSQVATVSPEGKVTGMQNGVATIAVRDAAGRVGAYPVIVSNVYRLIEARGPFDYNAAMAWIRAQPRSIVPDPAKMNGLLVAINTKYGGNWSLECPHWYGPSFDSTYPYGFVHTNGRAINMSNSPSLDNIKGAVCFVLT